MLYACADERVAAAPQPLRVVAVAHAAPGAAPGGRAQPRAARRAAALRVGALRSARAARRLPALARSVTDHHHHQFLFVNF